MNLPETVNNGSNTLTYTDTASGEKLKRVSSQTGTTDYDNGMVNDGRTVFLQTEEGRAIKSGSKFNHEYSLTDHLGNSQVTFDTSSGSANVVQNTDYYAFGKEIPCAVTASTKNEYLYNGKELQEETQTYDYGWRRYDPLIARWTSVDPSAEKSRRWSPYNYAVDNPIRFIDPDGKEIINIPGGVRYT